MKVAWSMTSASCDIRGRLQWHQIIAHSRAHRIIIFAVSKIVQRVQRLLAHTRVCIIQMLVKHRPTHVHHDGTLGLRGAFVY